MEKPFLVDTGKGFNLKYKNRLFYSSATPEAAVVKKIAYLTIREKTLVFVPSPGLGYGLKELAAKLPAAAHILCIETDKVLWDFYLNQKTVTIPENRQLTILHTDSPEELAKALKTIGIHQFRRAVMVTLCGGFGLYPAIYTRLFKIIEEEIQNYWQNKLTLIHMAPLWIKNLFTNLHTIQEIQPLSSLKTGKPLLVTGAGPSLEDSIDCIKKIREKVLLICVDTAFPVLRQYGIMPDYILIVEAQIANLWDFIICINPGIPVICDLSSNAHVIRTLKTKVFLFCSEFYPVQLFSRMQAKGIMPMQIPPLGSVGIAALYIAAGITSGPVLFTGLDFSYTKNKTHSRGAPFSDHILIHTHRLHTQEMQIYSAIKKRPLLKAVGKNQEQLLTDLVLKSYADKARQLLNNYKRFYDLGSTGLDLGAIRITAPDAIMHLLAETPPAHPRKAEPAFSSFIIAAYLQEEQNLLCRAARAVSRVLERKTHPEPDNREQLLNLLEQLDYVYLNFPDPAPLPSLEEHVLLRILIAIKHYLVILERLNGKEGEI